MYVVFYYRLFVFITIYAKITNIYNFIDVTNTKLKGVFYETNG